MRQISPAAWSLAAYILVSLFGLSEKTFASTMWMSDFETGNLSAFPVVLNEQGITLEQACAESGRYGAKFTLTGDPAFLWNGDPRLERTELHVSPKKGETAEGKTTFFSFYYYLPQALSDTRHEIAYWEARESWKQMFRFTISGSELSFQETAQAKPFWRLPTGASPNRWHKLSMRILWSTDPAKGYVKVWVDRKFLGEYHFQTLPAASAEMFAQIGLLRDHSPVTESLCIDSIRMRSR